MKTRTLELTAEAREIVGTKTPRSGAFAIELFCANLSASTEVRLYLSVSGEHWDIAELNGEDLVWTLVDDQAKVIQPECVPDMFWKLVFAGVTTGTVNCYTVN